MTAPLPEEKVAALAEALYGARVEDGSPAPLLPREDDRRHVAHILAPLVAGWLAEAEAERDALAAAVDRVRRRHPRGDEESTYLAPGLWCPTCGHERQDGGYGGCPDRRALIVPGQQARGPITRGDA